MQHIQEYQQLLEKQIHALELPKEPKNLYDPLRYFLTLGGKRTRPSLTMLACHLFGSPGIKAINAALAVELFHNFTLIHDDIMDDAAIDSMKSNNVVPDRINSAFIARINGDWTPNYSLSCEKNDVANKKGYMGLWILDPVNQSMTQIENWKDGKTTNVQQLFKMKEQFKYDY